MKKSLFVAVYLVSSLLLPAQDYYKQGRFVVQGSVKGYTEPTIDFGMTTFFGYVQNSIVVKPDGTFNQSFPVQHRQDIYFHLNGDAIPFTVLAGDTLKLNWDVKDFDKSFRIAGKNKERTGELAIEETRYWQVHRRLRNLYDSLRKMEKRPDPKIICHSFNDFYNQEVQTFLDFAGNTITPQINYLITGVYFRYLKMMKSMDRRSPEPSRPTLALNKKKSFPLFWIADSANLPAPYLTLREDWWLNVPEYRDYLFDYVRFGQPINGHLFQTAGTSQPQLLHQVSTGSGQAVVSSNEETTPTSLLLSFTYKDIQNGEKYLSIKPVREWFQAQAVIFGFGYYSFEETEKAYATIRGKWTSDYLRDTLEKFYTAKLRLKPGSPAPPFSLRDEKGKKVALADFRGKVVYIDFWGVGCGPCIYDIKNHVPQLQKRYEGKDVVFVNICVDAKGKEWRGALQKYKLEGVNLYADGWTKNPVCQDYNVQGIPHHVLIDKAGNIADNNAPRAHELLQSGDRNAIEKLLK